jgi:methionyl-tRNA formyltransferase
VRVVYFGTPDFAVPALESLAADDRFDVRLVVSQPDRPAGRGRVVGSSPVAVAARGLGVPLYQPTTLRSAEDRAPLVATEADVFVVAAFGLIFGRATLAIPRVGCVNLHASLLPRYRGASPILAAILSGKTMTGVTMMEMDAGLDTGGVIAEIEEAILADDTTDSLSLRLAQSAATLVGDELPHYIAGRRAARPQPARGASLTRLISKADGWLQWTRSATDLERQVRAMWSWPRAWTTVGDDQLQVHRARVVPEPVGTSEPGTLVGQEPTPVVVCGTNALSLEVVQLAGRKPSEGSAFVRGLRFGGGLVLGERGAPEVAAPLVVPIPE